MFRFLLWFYAFCISIMLPLFACLSLAEYKNISIPIYVISVGSSLIFLGYYSFVGITYRLKEEKEK